MVLLFLNVLFLSNCVVVVYVVLTRMYLVLCAIIGSNVNACAACYVWSSLLVLEFMVPCVTLRRGTDDRPRGRQTDRTLNAYDSITISRKLPLDNF